MSLLATTDDAEQMALGWMQKRYGNKLGRVRFVEAMVGNGVWTVKANVKLSTGLLVFKPHLVQLKIDSVSSEVLGYSETEISAKAE